MMQEVSGEQFVCRIDVTATPELFEESPGGDVVLSDRQRAPSQQRPRYGSQCRVSRSTSDFLFGFSDLPRHVISSLIM
jgi:hypothetical protein